MPQGRRKVPFSGKAKKEQLKSKQQFKKDRPGKTAFLVRNSDDDDDDDDDDRPRSTKINQQPNKNSRLKSNRYALKFYSDSPEEIQKNKELAQNEIIPVPEKDLEISIDEYFPKDLTFPKRPTWSYKMDKQELELREQRYFTEYLNELEKHEDWKKMSYFELNLETWRQFWRVLEMSDVILFIVDIRYAALMFPPALYEYVTNGLKKDMILVLNKIDLVPSSLVVAWKNYFKTTYPELHIVLFTTLPGYNLRGCPTEKAGLNIRRRKGRVRMAAEGAQMIFDACQTIAGENIDLNSWKKKINEEMSTEYDDEESLDIGEVVHLDKVDTTYFEHEKFKNGILTIGCLGQPNVGKSSLMNAIMGKKVVSVSRTPGHTKHFQTIFLTPNVRLCDCPGLVFPSQVPKPLQVLMGSYPIAQLRDPYTTIKFLAERLNLVQLLKLQHPTNDDTWSSIDICDGWAKKRGFLTAKAARFDSYRAANNILRMTLDGKISLCLYPPDYIEKKAEWENHPDNKIVQWIKAITTEEDLGAASSKIDTYVDEDDDDDDDDKSETEQLSENNQSEADESSEQTDNDNIKSQNMFALLQNE